MNPPTTGPAPQGTAFRPPIPVPQPQSYAAAPVQPQSYAAPVQPATASYAYAPQPAPATNTQYGGRPVAVAPQPAAATNAQYGVRPVAVQCPPAQAPYTQYGVRPVTAAPQPISAPHTQHIGQPVVAAAPPQAAYTTPVPTAVPAAPAGAVVAQGYAVAPAPAVSEVATITERRRTDGKALDLLIGLFSCGIHLLFCPITHLHVEIAHNANVNLQVSSVDQNGSVTDSFSIPPGKTYRNDISYLPENADIFKGAMLPYKYQFADGRKFIVDQGKRVKATIS